jgi:hypothetical protein
MKKPIPTPFEDVVFIGLIIKEILLIPYYEAE